MLKNKVAMVTGAGRGIGRAIAMEMAQAGADIAILYERNEQAAADTQAAIEAVGRTVRIYRCDVSDYENAKETVRQVIGDFGRVDILVNNAGITRDALVVAMRPDQFSQVIQTNLTGAFHMIREAGAHFARNRAGRIINIASVSGIFGNAGQANYAAAKAGLIGMTKTVARELASRNVTCNAIAPGFIETDMTASLAGNVVDSLMAKIPVGKMGKPEDVAGIAVFLASDRASYITGEVIKVDGGLCM